ncbi:hypothetical protein [Embleya sp. NBC_00896]|nr:hypothetical protein OG928_37000 [Embleya sp. NBC_00896]
MPQVFHPAADAPTLAGAFATAAFNVGGALPPNACRGSRVTPGTAG